MITEVTIQHENGTQWILVYYLQVLPSQIDGELYALRVDKLTRDGVLLEKAETYALTNSRKEALRMVKAFAKGTVPPSVLLEMADDWEFPTQSTPVHTYHKAG
jgi:hypothetical protein